ncbi:MAG TPA: hypothetical protein DCY79_23835 [Planctomycetaceae bacterium]|nr:hypothetical protein [Planctomycetaceae bacterium]
MKEWTRRNWLRVVSGAAVGSALPAFGDEGSKVRETSGCTLGFSTYGMKTLTTENAIETLANIGYGAVELTVRSGWDADSAQLTAKRRGELRTRLQDTGLVLASLMEHVYPADDKQQRNAVQRLKLAAQLAHDLSPQRPPLIQTVLGGGNFEARKQELRDRLGDWLDVANDARVTIAVKPHRGGVVSQPREAVWLFEQLGKPARLRMVYDYSHYAFRDLPVDQTIRTALPFTAHIAVKDAVQEKGRVVFRLPGAAGTIDFADVIKRFVAGGYRGDLNCEVSGMVWGQPGYDPIAAARTCYANLSKAFAKAGVEPA